ncbi:MAG TPA: four helix bundle protein [Gemmatimonadaceae bacterium]|jgi:four helix bundle protein
MKTPEVPSFIEWVAAAREARTGDPLWSVQAHRLALYAIACHTSDRQANIEFAQAATFDQLSRAIGSIAANIAEGYSRASLPDRNRFYEYALGSTREAIDWYDTVRVELGLATDERQSTLIQIRRLLLTTLRTSRGGGPPLSIADPTRRTTSVDDS